MRLRLFAALPIPDFVADRLVPMQKGVPGAAWRPRDSFHITLRFFGEIDGAKAEDLDGELAQVRVKPFELALKAAGSFGGADPRSLWIGVEPHPSLLLLAEGCERAARRAGLAPDARRFSPHVTLAYIRSGTDLERIRAFERRCALFRSPAFAVDRFHLYSSHERKKGPNAYVAEAEYPLW